MVKLLRRNLPCGTHYGIGIICLTEAREQQERERQESNKRALSKNDSRDAKNMADKSTKINIFIIREAL